MSHNRPYRWGGGLLVVFLGAASAACGQTTKSSQSSRPKDVFGPDVVRPFEGIAVTRDRREVQIAGQVVQTSAVLELFACTAGKEHESVVRLDARPRDVHAALLLIGLKPGRPAWWDDKGQAHAPEGDAVEVRVRYRGPHGVVESPAHEWIRRADGGPLGRPLHWVFCGSMVSDDGTYAADLEGTVITVVNFMSAVLDLPARHSTDNTDLTMAAEPKAIPPAGTPVAVVLRRKVFGEIVLNMDRFGRFWLGGEAIGRGDVVPRMRAALAADADLRVLMQISPQALPADIDAVVRLLREAGVAAEGIRRQQTRPATAPAERRPAETRPTTQALRGFPGAAAQLARTIMADGPRLAAEIADGFRPWGELLDQATGNRPTIRRPESSPHIIK